MSLIYSFVARGSTVLADYTSYSGNFSTVAIQCLQKCLKSEDGEQTPGKITFNADRHTFNYLVDENYVYTVVADISLGRSLPYAFLDRIQAEFREKHADKAENAVAHSLDKSFGPRLKAMMEYVVTHQEEFNKVALVQRKVEDVKSVMNDNVYKVLDRGEKIEVLVDKTESMQTQANRFNKAGSALKDKMFWAALRAKLLFIVIGIVVVLGIIFTICGSSLCGLIGSGGEEPAPVAVQPAFIPSSFIPSLPAVATNLAPGSTGSAIVSMNPSPQNATQQIQNAADTAAMGSSHIEIQTNRGH